MSAAAKIALAHGGFPPFIIDYLDQRFRNIDSSVPDGNIILVTHGLLILLKATGHGPDTLSAVNEFDTNDKNDQLRLRS